VRDQTARIYTFTAKTERDPDALARALHWRRAVVAADPGDPTGWLDLAEAELNAGEIDAAAQAFQQTLARNPLSARALNGLGRIELAEGSDHRAAEYFRRSLRVRPKQPEIRNLLAAVERE
jgi:cytochrome c-type biogenesis protein CcmH/NrfG